MAAAPPFAQRRRPSAHPLSHRGSVAGSYATPPDDAASAQRAKEVRNALSQGEDMLGLADTVLNMNTSVHQLSDHLNAVRTAIKGLPRSESTEGSVSTTEQLEILQSLSRDHAAIYAHSAKLKVITDGPEAVLSNLEAATALRTRRSTAIRLESGPDQASSSSSTRHQPSGMWEGSPDRSEPAIIVLRSSVTAYTLALLHSVQTFLLADGRQAILAGASRAHEKSKNKSTTPAPAHLSLNHTLLSALFSGSAHSSASSIGSRQPKFDIPGSPSTEQVLTILSQWAERARLSMQGRASLSSKVSTSASANRPSVYGSTLVRLSSLDDAGRAEISLLSTFRRLEGLTARVLRKTAAAASLSTESERYSSVAALMRESLSKLREEMMVQLHERVEQLFHLELDLFTREIRTILEAGLRGLHFTGEDVADFEPAPELDPFQHLFTVDRQAASSSSAIEQSRELNSSLESRICADSKLLDAVLRAVRNAVNRLGSRINGWASGLDKIYEHLGGLDAQDTKDAIEDEQTSRNATASSPLHDLKLRYAALVHGSIESLLNELGEQITARQQPEEHPQGPDESLRLHETAARAIFAYKVVDALLHDRTVLRVLIRDDGPGARAVPADEDRVQAVLDAARGRCLASWRSLIIEQALWEYTHAAEPNSGAAKNAPARADGEDESEQRKEDGAKATTAQPTTPSPALLRALESLRTGVLALGLQRAAVYVRDGGPSLLADFSQRLGQSGVDAAEAAAAAALPLF